jgi:hypothetical protein
MDRFRQREQQRFRGAEGRQGKGRCCFDVECSDAVITIVVMIVAGPAPLGPKQLEKAFTAVELQHPTR